MGIRPALVLFLAVQVTGCSSRGGAARNPGSPTPIEGPGPGPAPANPPQADPGNQGTGGLPAHAAVPVRAAQAPLVQIREALEADSLLGRRVRVAGRCTAAGEGRSAGSWTLEAAGDAIEVRGLVPSSCAAATGEELTIFAQIEPKSAGSKARLLLRLPD
jgi:hypothetical protein